MRVLLAHTHQVGVLLQFVERHHGVERQLVQASLAESCSKDKTDKQHSKNYYIYGKPENQLKLPTRIYFAAHECTKHAI